MKWMYNQEGDYKQDRCVFRTKPTGHLQLHERGVLWGNKILFSDRSEIPLGGNMQSLNIHFIP